MLGDYRPYRRTDHALSHLYHDIQCRPYTLWSIGYLWIVVQNGVITSELLTQADQQISHRCTMRGTICPV